MNTKTFFQTLFHLMLPIVVQNLISAVVSTADVLMLTGIGQNALSAVSLAGQVSFVLSLFYFGLFSGASVLSAQYWGKRDLETVSKVQGLAIRYSTGVSLVFFLAAILMPERLMCIFTADETLIAYGSVYLRIVSFSYLASGFSSALLNTMRSMEQTRISALISTACLLCNIALNAVSIFILFPSNEVLALGGVAAATVIARLLEVALCLLAVRKGTGLPVSFRQVWRSPRWLVRDFWHSDWPVQANYLIWGGATAAMSAIMGHMGSDMVAASSLASTLRNLVIIGCSSLGTAGSILVGKALGKSDFDQARAIGQHIFRWSLLLGAASGVVLLCLYGPCVAVTELTEGAEALFGMMLFINAVYCIGKSFNSSMVAGVFCAGGDTRFGLICDTVAMWGVVLPLGYLAAFVWQQSPVIVYIILCLDEFVKLPFVAKRFLQYKWLNNLTRGTNA